MLLRSSLETAWSIPAFASALDDTCLGVGELFVAMMEIVAEQKRLATLANRQRGDPARSVDAVKGTETARSASSVAPLTPARRPPFSESSMADLFVRLAIATVPSTTKRQAGNLQLLHAARVSLRMRHFANCIQTAPVTRFSAAVYLVPAVMHCGVCTFLYAHNYI